MTSPKVFISYSHDTEQHMEAMLALWNQLCLEEIDCRIDRAEQLPEEGWPLWCERQVEEAEFVLVICTETYLRRYKKKEVRGKGRGVTWEGHIITQELYEAQGRNKKFIPVVVREEDIAFIPLVLRSATIFQIYDQYDALYRLLSGQPEIVKPLPVGGRKLPPRKLPLPGAQPDLTPKPAQIWHMRHRRNVFFTGRADVIEGVHKALADRGTAALPGMGGVGKTQTAIEYAYRYSAEYTAVFWVDAEARELLLAGFAAVAGALGLASANAANQQEAVAEVRRWLETNKGWLLILDNGDDLSLVREFLPGDFSETRGHVLLTTREPAVQALADPVAVWPMQEAVGAALLLRRAGVITRNAELAAASEIDRRDALALSKELGGLPLALDQAGAYIEKKKKSVADYARLYAKRKDVLLAERGELGDHPSVTVTFSLAFEKVAAANAAAADLIRMCAFLAPEAIPEEIFTGGDASVLGDPLGAAVADELAFDDAIALVLGSSLLKRDPANRTLTIHRLVQAVVQAEIDEAERKIWVERVVQAVDRAFPAPEFANWRLCERLIVHAQSCADLIRDWDLESKEAARLLNGAAYYLDERAGYVEAEPLYQRSLAIGERALGPDHPDVATSLNNLAGLYSNQGRYVEAEPLYQRSLAIRERALGPDHPDVARSLNNLAELYSNQGRYVEAEPLYQRSLAIRERALGPDHREVAASLNDLARLYWNQGRYVEAEPLYQRSLAIWERALGPDHPDVALSLNNLAELYMNQARYAEAESLCQRSLATWERALGSGHPYVAISLGNLATFYEKLNRHAEAEPYRRRLQELGAGDGVRDGA